MGDDTETTEDASLGPDAPATRRWLRWGKVYVEIEPPYAPNPWTMPGWEAAGPEAPVLAPPAPGGWRRPALLFTAAALLAALLASLLVLAFSRHDRRAVLLPPATTTTTTAAPTTTTRPRATVTTPVTRPATAPPTSAATPPAGSSSTVPTAATVPPGGGPAPITIPEGVPVPTTAPSQPTPSTAPSQPPATTPTTVPSNGAGGPTTTATSRAFLGVTVEESADGPHIVDIFPDSGAERAGLLPNDVITAVDSTAVTTNDELGAAILSHQPGDSVVVTVLRNGASTTLRATLGTR